MKLCGAPATSDNCTLSQSAPTVLSTTAQPCIVAFAVGRTRKDDAVSRFPDRNLADVTHAQFALALSEGIERQVAQAGGVSGREQFEITVELALEIGVERAHTQRRRQLDDPHRAGCCNQREIELLDCLVGVAAGKFSVRDSMESKRPVIVPPGAPVTSTRCPRSA